ncbi:LysR family transcriptional regulator [Paenibacillus albiflavus]|uniref:LysR family transcriptional regulator n=1 Tax=Paenibacillus albiflavus TaxID=2545760 RepID=A0A4R4E9G5_9BACL|nr:LysR family transcriptional regulator [Paenibacillus albiflavus]TCZ75827.1 LysR family transcriptional regulator [Paenibacillus albiflavus]
MEHWYSFARIVELSSLNKASRVLNISQPALSRQIMKLEEELEVKLFTRKGKRLELTRAGEICYEHALKFIHLQDQLMRNLKQFKGSDKNISFTIGASLTTLQSTLPDLLSAHLNRFPMIDVKASTGKTHEIVTMVKDRKVDIGLVASSIEVNGLICDPLFDDHLCLILPIGHPYANQLTITIDHLKSLPLILFSRGTWYRVLTDEWFQQYDIYPNIKMEIDSFEAIIRLVVSCNAATLLPQSYVRAHLEENNELVICHFPELEAMKRTTSLIFPRDAMDNETVQSFVHTAKTYYSYQNE